MNEVQAPVRYVALGDSLSEGVGDEPWPDGSPRGWTDRLAGLLAAHYEGRGVDYANLAVRGYRAAQVRDRQLAVALEMRPEVVTLTAGMNDLLRPRIDFAELRSTLVQIVAPLTAAGAQIVLVPIPDVSSVSAAGRLLSARRLRLNDIYRHLVSDHGVLPLTDTTGTVFEDRRAWSDDRLHLSPLGHERLAHAAAATLGLPVDFDWLAVPDGSAPARTVRTETIWLWQHVTPWAGRRLRRRSSGDERVPKRPGLDSWTSPASSTAVSPHRAPEDILNTPFPRDPHAQHHDSGRSLPAAVLWDMDGTLVDTEPYWMNAEHELVGSFGGVWTDELAHELVGNALLVSAQIIRDNSPVTLTPEEIVDWLLESVIRQMREHIPWRPGAAELLNQAVAQGIPNALVTMSYTSFAQVMIDELPPGTFATVVTGDTVTDGKPHPEPYLKAAAALGVDPADCLAVEDSPTGARSAVAAGARTVAVPHIVDVPDEVGAVRADSLAGHNLESLWQLTFEAPQRA